MKVPDRRTASTTALALLATATLALAYSGWLDELPRENFGGRLWEEAAWRSVRALIFDEVYQDAADPRLRIARWLGLVAFAWALFHAAAAFFGDRWRAVRARRARGHVLVLGDHPVAEAAALEARLHGGRVAWVTLREARVPRLMLVRTSASSADAFRAGGAAEASFVVLAGQDDAQTAALARRAKQEKVRDVRAHMTSAWTAEHLYQTGSGVGAFVFSEAQAAARQVLRRHPPFLVARRLGQRRVHALIVGAGELGLALADGLILNARTTDLERSRLTILDPCADERRNAFFARHPRAGQLADIEFLRLRAGAEPADRLADFPPGLGSPITCIYVCVGSSSDALSTAIALKETAARGDLPRVPILVRLREGAVLNPVEGGAASLDQAPLVSFGELRSVLGWSGVLSADPDKEARGVHESYCSFGRGPAKSQIWDQLSEGVRVANRRAIDHIPTKLASAGFDLEPWLRATGGRDLPTLALGETLFRDEAEREALARLEHERWAADRLLDGWRPGDARDDTRKRHPHLVPFEDLPEEVRNYDRRLVDWLDQFLRRSADGLRR